MESLSIIPPPVAEHTNTSINIVFMFYLTLQFLFAQHMVDNFRRKL